MPSPLSPLASPDSLLCKSWSDEASDASNGASRLSRLRSARDSESPFRSPLSFRHARHTLERGSVTLPKQPSVV